MDKLDPKDRRQAGKVVKDIAKGWRKMFGRKGKSVGLILKARPAYASPGLVKDFEEEDWGVLLRTLDDVPQPMLDQCPWDKLRVGFWTGVMSSDKTRKYLEYCPWESFGMEAWREILYYHPEYRDKFDVHSGLRYEDLDLENWEPDIW